MVGTELKHYRITRVVGRGGMGEVYAAEDTKLRRHVAVKVLPPSVADDAERRRRLEREAQIIAALNHPNIVTIFSIEQIERTYQGNLYAVSGNGDRFLLAIGGDAPIPITVVLNWQSVLAQDR